MIMDILQAALNAISPLILPVIVGYVLKKNSLILDDAFMATLERLCFCVLLPTLLFVNAYDCKSLVGIGCSLILYCALATIIVFVGCIVFAFSRIDRKKQKGVLLQCVYHPNYLIVALTFAKAFAGAEGTRVAGAMTIVIIPLFIILSTIALHVNGPDNQQNKSISITGLLRNIVTNPLIIGVATGFVALSVRSILVKVNCDFRLLNIHFLNIAIRLCAQAGLLLLLIMLGAQIASKAHKRTDKDNTETG